MYVCEGWGSKFLGTHITANLTWAHLVKKAHQRAQEAQSNLQANGKFLEEHHRKHPLSWYDHLVQPAAAPPKTERTWPRWLKQLKGLWEVPLQTWTWTWMLATSRGKPAASPQTSPTRVTLLVPSGSTGPSKQRLIDWGTAFPQDLWPPCTYTFTHQPP